MALSLSVFSSHVQYYSCLLCHYKNHTLTLLAWLFSFHILFYVVCSFMFCVVCSLSLPLPLIFYYSHFFTQSVVPLLCVYMLVCISLNFSSLLSLFLLSFFFLLSTKTKNSFTSLPTNPLTWSSSNTPFYLILLLKVVWCGVCLRVFSHIVYNNFLPFNFFLLEVALQRRKVKSVIVLVFWENVNRTHRDTRKYTWTEEQNKKHFILFRVLTFSSSSEIQDTYKNLQEYCRPSIDCNL